VTHSRFTAVRAPSDFVWHVEEEKNVIPPTFRVIRRFQDGTEEVYGAANTRGSAQRLLREARREDRTRARALEEGEDPC
jgi:hypothetical protein